MPVRDLTGHWRVRLIYTVAPRPPECSGNSVAHDKRPRTGSMQMTNFCALNPQISRMNADFLDFYPRHPRHLRIKQMPCL
jgi:hypothetical protein